MKKIILLTIFIAAIFLVARPILAAAPYRLDDPVMEGLNYATQAGYGTQNLRVSIMLLIKIILGFLGIVAIIIVLWGGWRWMTAGGNEENVRTAKAILIAGAIGLFIIFTAYAIATFVVRALGTAAGP